MNTATPVSEPLYVRSVMPTPCPLHDALLVRRNGKFGAFYACPNYPECDVCANKSKFDGHFHMTNQATRNARHEAHEAFDSLWKPRSETTMPRHKAYRWLADAMGLMFSQCHIMHFDAKQCAEVVRLVKVLKASRGDAAGKNDGHGEVANAK